MRKTLMATMILCFLVVAGWSQETRSTLTGLVRDKTGAIIPQAKITIRNQDTGALTEVLSNDRGVYNVPLLMPGTYEVKAELTGFRTYVHSGLELRTGAIVQEKITLDVGETSENVNIYGGTPLIDTSTASMSDVLQGDEVQDLPSNGRAPLGFAHMEFGVISKDKHAVSVTQPFNGQTTYDFSVGGGFAASNELLLNGAPNMSDSSRNNGFNPELDAVDAVKVDIFTANAAMGDTSGGFVNITTKSGTNQYHGSASEYYEGSRPLTAVAHYVATPVLSTHYHQFGGTFGGPINLPHLYHGHDKLFFFYSLEGFRQNSSTSTITSVPTDAEKNGDFSALLNDANGQLYNPWGGTLDPVSGHITRTTIPGNKLSNAGLSVDPIAQQYLKMMPSPNYNGPSTTADGQNNYNANAPITNRYLSNQLRIDYNLSTKNKIFVDIHRSRNDIKYGNIFQNILTGTDEMELFEGGQLSDVHNFSSSMNLESRLSFTRSGTHSEPTSYGTSSTTMGFTPYLQQNSQITAIPEITFKDTASTPQLSAMNSDVSGYEYYDSVQFYTSLNKTWKNHSFKFGADIRTAKNSTTNAPLDQATAAGSFVFQSSSGGFVTQSPNVAGEKTAQTFGGAFALFALGLPTDGSISYDTDFQYDNWYFAGFAQDDWKATPNLTLSLGLRLEHTTPFVEGQNRMSTTWIPNLANATTAAAETAYAASPSSYLSPSAFNPTGNVEFAHDGARSPFTTAALYPSPRVGFAWSPEFGHQKLTIRGGGGVYINPMGDWSKSQGLYDGIWYNYTQASSMVQSTDNYLTPATTWDNPFPTDSSKSNYNPILTVPGANCGNYCGINTKLGSDISFAAPLKMPYVEKWDLDVQKQFGNSWLVEVGYLGSHGIHDLDSNNISTSSYLPYLVHSPYGYDAAAISTTMTSTTVNNPFVGTMPGLTNSNGVFVPNQHKLNTKPTITLQSLLLNYPEYEQVVEQGIPEQSSTFEGLLVQVAKRMANGVEFHFNYEHSRLLGAMNRLNLGDRLSYGETTSDYPNHATFIGIYKLPFGKGERYFTNSRLGNAIGGWEVTSIYQYLSGTPVSWGNVIYNGNWHDFKSHAHNWKTPAFNTSVFDTRTYVDTNTKKQAVQPTSWNYRTFPAYALRADSTNNFDFSILKNFTIHNSIVIQPRVDAFNTFNHPQFGNPNVSPTSSNFGMVDSQQNSARQLQGGVHIRF